MSRISKLIKQAQADLEASGASEAVLSEEELQAVGELADLIRFEFKMCDYEFDTDEEEEAYLTFIAEKYHAILEKLNALAEQGEE